MNSRYLNLSLILCSLLSLSLQANPSADSVTVGSTSDYLVAQPFADRTVFYSTADEGVSLPINWGLDLAWLSEGNIRRGVAFMGKDIVTLVRSSFTPTAPLVDGDLPPTEMGRLNERIQIIKSFLNPDVKVVLNCDHPSVDPWYVGNAANWAQLIEVTAKHHEDAGLEVLTVSPFNEPDYSATGQGSIQDFYNIIKELRKNPYFNDIRISGGNTLNCDVALDWYAYLNGAGLDEGNTHQLAGDFDHFADFFRFVRNQNDHATDDELHNVMEAMVGVEYGMQTGIWWGTAEYARGEFCKASHGVRLGYAEHRPNWTSAAVYRHPDGKIQAFGGVSERQNIQTTYRFLSTDRPVYYDGYGPQHEFILDLPGAPNAGYYQDPTYHKNAEKVIHIQYGDDIQPAIEGRYVIINRNSGRAMEAAGANIKQRGYAQSNSQHWDVTPVGSGIGGDFSYFTFTNVLSGRAPDVLNWSLDNGGNIIAYDDVKSGNQQWYLEYAEDGWFYIRSRHSGLCMEVAGANTTDQGNIQQWEKTEGHHQQWRFLAVGSTIEFEAPETPANLQATAQQHSVLLTWEPSTSNDVDGYNIYRADSERGAYYTLAQQVSSTAFVDNTARPGTPYYYAVKATDKVLNKSGYSNQVGATPSGAPSLVMHLGMDGVLKDSTTNLFHAASYTTPTFVDGKEGQALALNGENEFLQLSSSLGHSREFTMAGWVYWKGGSPWQRIFEFAANDSTYFFLSPRMRFGITNNGSEQRLSAASLPRNEWVHVAVTLKEKMTRMFVNGEPVGSSGSINVSPADVHPIQNYMGRGLSSISYFNGYMDDFRLYNYALTDTAVKALAGIATEVKDAGTITPQSITAWPVPAQQTLYVRTATGLQASTLSIYSLSGQMVWSKPMHRDVVQQVDVSNLPDGIYILRLSGAGVNATQRIIVRN